jgi:aminoglycoside phosphotransferase (APT) family kinase protein
MTPLAVAVCLDSLEDESCKCDGGVARRINSRIHRVQCASRTLAIKECFGVTGQIPEPSAAEREFKALATLSSIPLNAGDQPIAPLPIVLCREHAAYAMTWVPGRPATELVLSRHTTDDGAAALGQASGAWLRRFHALRTLPERESDFESKVEFVNEIVKSTPKPDPLLRHASERLVAYAEAASAVRMPASWVHGDMKSDNLLVDGERVTGLDVQLVHENTVVYDLAPFLNHLYLLRWTPRGVLQPRKLESMTEGFVRAYSPETKRWGLPIAWLRAYLLLQIAAPLQRLLPLRALARRTAARVELGRAIDSFDIRR